MKFIHIADIHFDTPFRMLSSKIQAGEERRLDQRRAFRTMIQYAKENKIDVIFIAGDLYEHELVRESTITYMNQLFRGNTGFPNLYSTRKS